VNGRRQLSRRNLACEELIEKSPPAIFGLSDLWLWSKRRRIASADGSPSLNRPAVRNRNRCRWQPKMMPWPSRRFAPQLWAPACYLDFEAMMQPIPL
jgi:hypothetical protein